MTAVREPAASGPPQAGSYRVVYADPPWRFSTYSEKGKGRSAEAHYDCMSLAEIKALPVAAWAAADAALLLWTTDPMLRQSLEVLDAWGFVYKTVAFYWVKLNKTRGANGGNDAGDDAEAGGLLLTERDFFTGMGFWTRANPEMCLLATRGRPQRRGTDVPKLLIAPRREHSRKPDAAYGRIERLLDGPYLELFARSRRPGWDGFGNEAGLFDGDAAGPPVQTRRRPSSAARRLAPDEPGR